MEVGERHHVRDVEHASIMSKKCIKQKDSGGIPVPAMSSRSNAIELAKKATVTSSSPVLWN
jgi:hypothetical protein